MRGIDVKWFNLFLAFCIKKFSCIYFVMYINIILVILYLKKKNYSINI